MFGDENKAIKKDKNVFDKVNEVLDMQKSWDKCSFCPKRLPPGSPSNRYFDAKLGPMIACVDCTMKALYWYARNMFGDKSSDDGK